MLDCFQEKEQTSLPIVVMSTDQFKEWLPQQDSVTQQWVRTSAFKAESGQYSLVPDKSGALRQVLFIINSINEFMLVGLLPSGLPTGSYRIENINPFFSESEQLFLLYLAWGLGSYQFNAYVTRENYPTKLTLGASIDRDLLTDMLSSIYLARDLINTPTEDLTPSQLAEAVNAVAEENNAEMILISGDDLIAENFPAIHAVGRAGDDAPCFIDMRWGDPQHCKITLVGKGICFDSGGLNLKSAKGMRHMKKDMGGAAIALGLARLIMRQNLPICLRLLIAAAENAVGGQSYRPGDVIATRGGLSVEITNTDAEGRLVVCDALAEAVREEPDYLMDFTTLTGAARVALGPELPVLFSNNEEMAQGLLTAGETVFDPLWRLPLYQPYRDYLKSDIADLSNAAETPYAGAITAALFLQNFVTRQIPWVHFDVLASNPETKPGRPKGGEAHALRAVFAFIKSLS